MADAPLEREQIEAILPHRGRALLIQRVLEVTPGKSAVGFRRIAVTDPFLEGHFPGNPVVPGTVIIEMMAQVAGVLTLLTVPEHMRGEGVALLGLDRTRFRRPVVPGDDLTVQVDIGHRRDPIWRFEGVASVGEERVVEASFLAGLLRSDRGLSGFRTGIGRKG